MNCRNPWIRLAAVGCCFLAGVLLPAASAAQDPNAVFSNPRHQKATELMRVGSYARAEAVLDATVKAEPTPDAYGLLGYAREMQNRFATAEKAYRESMRLAPDVLFARVRLGIVLTKQARHRESIEVLRPIETALHRHPEALFHLCLAYLETGESAKAAASAEKMEAFGPEMALRVAKLFVWKEKFPESLPLLSRVADASPGSAEANYLLATALFRTDQTGRMWPYLEKAHRLDPDSVPTLLLYGSALLAEGKFGQARERLLQAQALRPQDPRLRFLLGKALIGEGDHAGAIAQLEALVKQDPDKPEVHLVLLSAYRSKGDIQATTRQARQAVRKFPGHLGSQLEAGMDLQTVGEFELAEQALRRGGRSIRRQTGGPAPSPIQSGDGSGQAGPGRPGRAAFERRGGCRSRGSGGPGGVGRQLPADGQIRTGRPGAAGSRRSGCQEQAGAPALGQGLHPAGPP